MNKRHFGLLITTGTVITLLIDRFAIIISNYLGKIYCGGKFMRPVEGIVGEESCGFNADMYLFVAFLTVFLVGVLLLTLPARKI